MISVWQAICLAAGSFSMLIVSVEVQLQATWSPLASLHSKLSLHLRVPPFEVAILLLVEVELHTFEGSCDLLGPLITILFLLCLLQAFAFLIQQYLALTGPLPAISALERARLGGLRGARRRLLVLRQLVLGYALAHAPHSQAPELA